MSTSIRIVAAALLVAVIDPPCASAQEKQAPLDTVLEAYISREVRVRDAGGMSLDGAIASIHDGQLEMLTRGGTRTLPLDSIVRVERYGDSLVNGCLMGAAIGTAMWLATYGGDMHREDIPMYLFGGVMVASVYGLVGAGIDALNTGWTPVYVRKDKRPQPGTAGPRALLSVRIRF